MSDRFPTQQHYDAFIEYWGKDYMQAYKEVWIRYYELPNNYPPNLLERARVREWNLNMWCEHASAIGIEDCMFDAFDEEDEIRLRKMAGYWPRPYRRPKSTLTPNEQLELLEAKLLGKGYIKK